jgi:hypothetical protein
MGDVLDSLYYKLKATAGLCTKSRVEDVVDILEKGEQYSQRASQVLAFTKLDADAAKRLQEAAESLGGLKKAIGKVNSLCQDLKQVEKMADAMAILNQWADGKIDRNDPAAAAAFGKLFEAAGSFASKLPPPFNAYGKLLGSCGTFFVDMQRIMDPDNRSIGGGKRLKDLKYDGTD